MGLLIHFDDDDEQPYDADDELGASKHADCRGNGRRGGAVFAGVKNLNKRSFSTISFLLDRLIDHIQFCEKRKVTLF